jgi:hypothetical protein
MASGDMPPSLKESLEHSIAEYRQLGKSGLRVSVPILGAMGIGDPAWAPWVVGEEEVRCPETGMHGHPALTHSRRCPSSGLRMTGASTRYVAGAGSARRRG